MSLLLDPTCLITRDELAISIVAIFWFYFFTLKDSANNCLGCMDEGI